MHIPLYKLFKIYWTETYRVVPTTLVQIYPFWPALYSMERAASTVEDAKTCWKQLKESFGKLQPKVLTKQLIENYKAKRIADGVKPRTINKELSYLSSMLTWAAENDYCAPLPFTFPSSGRR